MPKIIICADDFSLNDAVSYGILHLLKIKRISATSCMTTTSNWKQHATFLLPYLNNIDIGLHFNLTDGDSLTQAKTITHKGQFYPLKKLMVLAILGKLKQKDIEDEFNKQLDFFIDLVGKVPDFIDGHQHIHHFPVIREAILSVYQRRLVQSKPYIRIACNSSIATLINRTPKEQIIAYTGALKLRNYLQNKRIPHNSSFAGIYNFNQSQNYHKIFPKFLKTLKNNGLLMCHPGYKSTDVQDSIANSRFDELSYLASDEFITVCADYNIQISRFTGAENSLAAMLPPKV